MAEDMHLLHAILASHIQELLDAWATFALAQTCLAAGHGAQESLQQQRQAMRSLMDMARYLKRAPPFIPGFDEDDILASKLLPLTYWAPPFHRALRFNNRPAFMWNSFRYSSRDYINLWINSEPEYHGLSPLQALEAMNPLRRESERFAEVVNIFKEGNASFWFSPFVLDATIPHEEDQGPFNCTGPGLMIIFRYRSFPMVLCLRYSEITFMDKIFWPWIEMHAEDEDDHEDYGL